MKKNKLIAIFGTCFFLAVSGGQGLQAQAAEAVMITEVPAAEVAGIGAVVVAEVAAAHSISGGPVKVQGSVAATETAVISESPTAAGSFSIQLSSPAAQQGSAAGRQVASFAQQFIGNPYVYGGTSLTNGADCSGFVMAVYEHFGVSLPHSSAQLAHEGTGVGTDLNNAQPGDLICYSGHVGIYIGNGKIVHASTEETGIKISNADYKTIRSIRRIL